MNQVSRNTLKLKPLGINTYRESVLYMRTDCHVCTAEGFEVQMRVRVHFKGKSIIATVQTIDTNILHPNEASLSTYAWAHLEAIEGEDITISHHRPLTSLSFVRSKLYGNTLSELEINSIIKDISKSRFSDINIAMFLSACVGGHLNQEEIYHLTNAMVQTGSHLHWDSDIIVDKHCIGGLPGNRTSLIVVPIVAAFGLMIPKTSSRAITSPAGTADVMEIFAPVNLDLKKMKQIAEKENGCLVWGGAVSLSPADDILITIERIMDLDSEGQMVASVLSKKIAAGATHILIDIPLGPTAKVRSISMANLVKSHLENISRKFNIETQVIITDGSQPIGRGIGPALEAKDALDVLSCHPGAPQDLREKALLLAGHIIEFSPKIKKGEGHQIAHHILESGQALQKFQSICEAQGGFAKIPKASHTHEIKAGRSGIVTAIDNRRLARLAKSTGAPHIKTAGLEILVKLDHLVQKDQPILILHAETLDQLNYALSFYNDESDMITLSEMGPQ